MLSKNIARLRKSRGLTQVELAKTLHVTQSAVSHWESGRSIPDTVQLFQIAEFFGTSVDDIKTEKPQASTAKENKPLPETEQKKEDNNPSQDPIFAALAKLNPENRALVEQMARKLRESQHNNAET